MKIKNDKHQKYFAIFLFAINYNSGVRSRLYRIMCKVRNLLLKNYSHRYLMDFELYQLNKQGLLTYIHLIEKYGN